MVENIGAVLLAQQAGLEHGLGQFLHEQRHAVGLGDDLIQHFRRQRLAGGDAIDHRQRLSPPEAAERKRRHVRAPNPGRGEFGTEGDHQQGAQVGSRSTSRPNTSSDVGSIQCASSSSASTGASSVSPSSIAMSAAIVRSFCSPGAISIGGYRPSPGIDNSAARKGAIAFASNPDRAIIASSLSSFAAAGSPLTRPAACQMWLAIG